MKMSETKPLIGLHLYGGSGGGIAAVVRNITSGPLVADFRFITIAPPSDSGTFNLKTWRTVINCIKAASPDLLHISGLLSEGFVAMAGAILSSSAPRLLGVHGFAKDALFVDPKRRGFVSTLLEPLTVLLAEAVYCVSNYGARQDVIRQFARRNLGVIHNGVPIYPLMSSPSSQRAAFGFTDAHVVGICVSRLSRAKGLLVLAEAVDQLVHSGENRLRLLMVGDGPDRAIIQRAFGANVDKQHVIFMGNRLDVHNLLELADFFVLPSLNENLSIAILEAMERGKPVVSTWAGGTPEVVHSGETGILVPPNDARALAEAMAQMVDSLELRLQLGAAGRQRVIAHFSLEHFSNQLAIAYRDLLMQR